jgi:hypothetical protein
MEVKICLYAKKLLHEGAVEVKFHASEIRNGRRSDSTPGEGGGRPVAR